MSNMPFQGSLAGHQYATLTTAGKTWQADRVFLVRQIKFQAPVNTAITTQTVQIKAENQDVFASAVPIRMLAAAVSEQNVAPGVDNVITYKPIRPFLWSPGFPLTITPSTTMQVMIEAEEVLSSRPS